MLKKVILKG